MEMISKFPMLCTAEKMSLLISSLNFWGLLVTEDSGQIGPGYNAQTGQRQNNHPKGKRAKDVQKGDEMKTSP